MFNSPIPRAIWLGVLSRSGAGELVSWLAKAPALPGFIHLRGPESGMSMVRGRAGGGGTPFNLGEMTLSRCSIRDDAGRVGHGYAAGRDLALVELIARLDAVLQDDTQYLAYHDAVLAPLAATQTAKRAKIEARAVATEVKFFTMGAMRG